MAISKDKRDHIITHYTDHTIRELASMHSVSTSTVQRVIAQAKSQQESMKNDANTTSSMNTDADAQAQIVPGDTDSAPAGNNNDHFQYVPDLPEDQKEVLELHEDTGMSKLLQGLQDEDPFKSLVDEQQQESNTASEPPPAATNTPATATLPAADDMADQEGLDAMIESLLGEPTAASSKRKKNTGASTKTDNSNGTHFVSSNNNNTMIKASPYSTGISADIPTPIIRTQCQLYAEHFKTLL